MPATGARGTASTSPQNLTGRIYRANQRVQETRRKQAEAAQRALEALADAAGGGDDPAEVAARHDGATVYQDNGQIVVDFTQKYRA
jgi:hypothetical protein